MLDSGLQSILSTTEQHYNIIQVFPRLFYVSDDSLLSVLSNPKSVTSLKPHLVSLFGAVGDVVVAGSSQNGETPVITAVESIQGECLNLINPVSEPF